MHQPLFGVRAMCDVESVKAINQISGSQHFPKSPNQRAQAHNLPIWTHITYLLQILHTKDQCQHRPYSHAIIGIYQTKTPQHVANPLAHVVPWKRTTDQWHPWAALSQHVSPAGAERFHTGGLRHHQPPEVGSFEPWKEETGLSGGLREDLGKSL